MLHTQTVSNIADKQQLRIISNSALPPLYGDTLVIELLCKEAVGSDASGEERVQTYLKEVAELLQEDPILSPKTHLSEKYGLSGWLPLKRSAIHFYAWDHVDQPFFPFVSVDINTSYLLEDKDKLMEHAKNYFGAKEIIFKTMRNPQEGQWKELAPHIIRQRHAFFGFPKKTLPTYKVGAFLEKLAIVLKMKQLSPPILVANSGWMHWETSGVIVRYNEADFALNIYTCKTFDPKLTLEFLQSSLNVDIFFETAF